jgi:hypothetical protein
MRNTHLPSRVAEPHSETAFMTDQAIRFMQRQGSQPWVLHLSYVKPHWPYMAPAPYHAMYSAEQCLPVVRSEAELKDAHPVLAAYRQHEESRYPLPDREEDSRGHDQRHACYEPEAQGSADDHPKIVVRPQGSFRNTGPAHSSAARESRAGFSRVVHTGDRFPRALRRQPSRYVHLGRLVSVGLRLGRP